MLVLSTMSSHCGPLYVLYIYYYIYIYCMGSIHILYIYCIFF